MDTSRIEALIEQARRGDGRSRDELLVIANQEIERLAKKKLSAFPIVHVWFDTAEVGQIALIQFYLALEQVDLADAEHFYRLVATKLRQTLLQLKRQVAGPLGLATHIRHGAVLGDSSSAMQAIPVPASDTHDPRKLAQWLEIHEAIAALSEDDQQMFDLLWYNELSAGAAAAVLGVGVRETQRRWRAAQIRLVRSIGRPFEK